MKASRQSYCEHRPARLSKGTDQNLLRPALPLIPKARLLTSIADAGVV